MATPNLCGENAVQDREGVSGRLARPGPCTGKHIFTFQNLLNAAALYIAREQQGNG